jgi:predicted nucleotidyltransferase component of viral defense system
LKQEALQLAEAQTDPAMAMNVLREYLQALALRSLHESEAFSSLAFVGGTALRFAHGLARFSEDLDFSLENSRGYQPGQWVRKLKRDLELADLAASITWNDKTTVHKAWIRWADILHDAGLSPHAEQKLSIKIEIDTRPPAGAVSERQIITRHRILALQLYDLSSLMAGKLHALITRSYAKGRDWYDLLWYCGLRPAVHPNLEQLQNALDQTQDGGRFKASDWDRLCLERFEQLDNAQIVADVAPFLERPKEAAMLSPENVRAALGRVHASSRDRGLD